MYNGDKPTCEREVKPVKVERNASCPCGSGKKYKKCCMIQKQAVDLRKEREARYFQRKLELTAEITHFVNDMISFAKREQIKRMIRKQIPSEKLSKYMDVFFQFYLNYFHTDERGRNGVSCFYEENGEWLSEEEKKLVRTWMDLVPRVIQMVDQNDHGRFVEDCFTKERFFMPYTDTMPKLPPWSGSFCMIEPFIEGYCIHGITVWESPRVIERIVGMIQERMKQTDKPYREVARESYLEIMALLLDGADMEKDEARPHTIRRIVRTFRMEHKERVVDFLFEQDSCVIDEWKDGDGTLSVLGGWLRYDDNECPEPLYLAPSHGQIEIAGDLLTFTYLHSAQSEASMNELRDALEGIRLEKEKTEEIQLPKHAEVASFAVQMGPITPPYFAVFAQNHLHVLNGLEQPVPLLNGFSPMELARRGEWEQLEKWLRELEYNTYAMAVHQFEEVSHTADFNLIRRTLGLPLSPFVSGGEERKTSLTPCSNPNRKPARFNREDIPLLEELGFTPTTAREFYAQDILRFLKENGLGKSRSTFRKYTNALETLAGFLAESHIRSWEQCTSEFWTELFAAYYLDTHYDASLSQANSFFSVMKRFAKWLDNHKQTQLCPAVTEVLSAVEEEIYDCIRLLDQYASLYQRRYHSESLVRLGAVLRGSFSGFTQTKDGFFQVISRNQQHVVMCDLADSNMKRYKVKMVPDGQHYVQEGMLLAATIGCKHKHTWELINIERAFPREARKYLI
jgi:uncharacterized protein YecA (UPF0149 family)